MSNMKQYYVSIIIPSFNKGDLILGTIESVYASDFQGQLEVIIIDDNSTDPETIHAYQVIRKKYPMVIIKENEHKHPHTIGPGSARNLGLKICHGQYVVFLDNDDLITPNFLSSALDTIISKQGISFVYSDIITFGSQTGLRITPEYSLDRLKKYNYIPVTSLFKKQPLVNVAGFRTNLFSMEDWDLFIRLGLKRCFGQKIPKEKEAYLLYRITKGQGVNQSASSPRKRFVVRNQILKANKLYTPVSIFWNIAAIVYASLSSFSRVSESRAFDLINPASKTRINQLLSKAK
ncbi:MAG: glycosyltransferase [bacterium]|nr:glycosyltransferase [bacterium]